MTFPNPQPSRPPDASAATPAWQQPPPLPADLAEHPRYQLLEVLGEGGMGTVYKAKHRLMQRWVAIKVVRAAALDKPGPRARFLRELQAAARLDHPNIVHAHDAEEAGGVVFLVMEYLPGESLAHVVRRRGPLPVSEACAYVRQAALGLQHAHDCGLVHRDIKPGNLMLTPEGRVKVLDFGLARLLLDGQGAEQTSTGALLGTPAYMAPEQAQDPRKADSRADIYSLGCTLVHLLAGRPTVEPLTELRPDLPRPLATVLERMLASDPADRYQTPAEAAAALAPFAETKRSSPRSSSLRAGLLALALVAVVGLPAVLAYWHRGALEKSVDAARNEQKVWREDEPAQPGKEPGDNSRQNGGSVATDSAAGSLRLQTVIVLTSSSNPAVRGQAIQLTATVAAREPSSGTPTGEITFSLGEEVLGVAKLVQAQATLTTSTLPVGNHVLRARYGGDARYQADMSPGINQAVGRGPTVTVLQTNPRPAVGGRPVKLTATVAGIMPATGTPTGDVTFLADNETLGTVKLVAGQATLDIATLPQGTKVLRAHYNGDANFLPGDGLAQ